MIKIKRSLVIIFFVIVGFIMFFIWQNNDIVTTEIDYKSKKLPESFDGFTVVQISDLHNKRFGRGQKKLLKRIEKASPDIIVITGDIVDRRRFDLEPAAEFVQGAVKIAPVYYVSGNHEAWSGKYVKITEAMLKSGAKILDDEKVSIKKGGSRIELVGVLDPAFLTSGHIDGIDSSLLEKALESLANDSVFQILLSHRPELFSLYARKNIDLIFTGHAHGGQFRIPLLGGLVAPNQGFFPKYTSGMHRKENSAMIVNRGLGNSIIPVRIFNRPEIIKTVLTLEE